MIKVFLKEKNMGVKALDVVDLQNDISKNHKEIIENVNCAVDWAEYNMPVNYIKHNVLK